MRNLVGGIIKANDIFHFINDGDVLGVGVSGGKDSTLLLMALNYYKIFVKKKYGWNIKVYGIHINMNYYKNIKYDKYLKWLKKNKVSIKVIDSNVGEVLKAKLDKKGRVVCSLCAKMKKAIMVKEAKKYKINKLCTGHHIDDAIETLFMNLVNEGRIATFLPDSYLDRNDIHLIRPFILVKENDIIKVANRMKIPVLKNVCPNETTTQRQYIKNFIEQNFYKNKVLKNSYKNFQIALLNGKHSQLWFNKKHTKK